MYIDIEFMYIGWYLHGEGTLMATARNRSHKHFQLDAVKIKRAQKALRAKTETEAIERALDLAIAVHESNRLVLEANERFIKSGIDIKDVYGTLGS
jgi:alkyl hydroperoxide reductase subunit AhpF